MFCRHYIMSIFYLGYVMSINAINGFSNYQYGGIQQDPIKPETKQKLKVLGIDEKSVKTETQAQNKIQEKENTMRTEMREQMQAQAGSQSQSAQASSQIQQPQEVKGADKTQQVDGINQSQQIKEPQGIEQQHALNNQQQGNEQVKAFAGSNNAQIMGAIPFMQGSELVAMYNKFKLGLV